MRVQPQSALARDIAGSLAWVYDQWHKAEPEAGHDAQAAEWRAKRSDASQPAPDQSR